MNIADELEPIATKLADANAVEHAWFLRGVGDGLDGREFDLGMAEAGSAYRKHYFRGWSAGASQRESC